MKQPPRPILTQAQNIVDGVYERFCYKLFPGTYFFREVVPPSFPRGDLALQRLYIRLSVCHLLR